MTVRIPRSRVASAAVLAVAVALICGSPAQAWVRPVAVLDGPSADILDVGGVAMAPDGTGGIVYRKRSADGRPHIFAAQFVDGAWQSPQRVDIGQAFDSSWPRIAAGDGGRLMVVWVQEYGPGTDRLYSARLWPGSRGFAPPVSVDVSIGEATATWPTITMNAGGATIVAYRVITTTPSTGASGIPAGYAGTELRAARYRGPLWSSVGVLNRNTAVFSPPPTADNAPDVAIDAFGNAIIAWSEPDNDLVDRIWARRLYAGGAVGLPLIASPQVADAKVVSGGADQPAVSIAGNGAGVVAFRQDGRGTPSLGDRFRVMTNTLGDVETASPKAFAGATVVDQSTRSAQSPSVAMDAREDFRVSFLQDGAPLLAGTIAAKFAAPVLLDGGAGTGAPVVTDAPDGGTVAAWPTVTAAGAGVTVGERPGGGGAAQNTTLAAPAGGPITGLHIAGSGLGDALLAFRQGGDGDGQLTVGVVDAPPQPAITTAPTKFVRPAAAVVDWQPAGDALGGLHYSVVIDGQVWAQGLTTTSWQPAAGRLDDGTYTVAIVVTDAAGQQRLGDPVTLSVDGTAPVATVRARSHGRRATVLVRDGLRGQVSGVASGASRITWGDGHSARAAGQAGHRYARRGRYRVVVRTADRAGNTSTLSRRVLVR